MKKFIEDFKTGIKNTFFITILVFIYCLPLILGIVLVAIFNNALYLIIWILEILFIPIGYSIQKKIEYFLGWDW